MGSGPGLNLRYFCPLCLPVGGSGAASGENNTLEKPSNEMNDFDCFTIICT